MFEYIEKLRRKPERTKKQIAFSMALFISGTIFVVWLSVIYPDFKKNQAKIDSVSKLEPSPLGTFGDTLSTGVSTIGEEFSKLKDLIYSVSSSTAYYVSTTTDISTSTPTTLFVASTTASTTEQ